MCTNGSRAARWTPANARRTGNPSPSNPVGAVVTERTGRPAAVGSTAEIRGRATVSALMAGMNAPWGVEPHPFLSARMLAYATFPLDEALTRSRGVTTFLLSVHIVDTRVGGEVGVRARPDPAPRGRPGP